MKIRYSLSISLSAIGLGLLIYWLSIGFSTGYAQELKATIELSPVFQNLDGDPGDCNSIITITNESIDDPLIPFACYDFTFYGTQARDSFLYFGGCVYNEGETKVYDMAELPAIDFPYNSYQGWVVISSHYPFSAQLVSCPGIVDTTPPSGRITSPISNTTISPGTLLLSADAWDNPGGSGVKKVEFYIYYDGQWHNVGEVHTLPYEINWSTPEGLRSQILKLKIHVVDNADNVAVINEDYILPFIETSNNPTFRLNWIPEEQRVYLNQLFLSDGKIKCGAASETMVLAMNRVIASDPQTLKEKAEEIDPRLREEGDDGRYHVMVYKIRDDLRNHGMQSDYFEGSPDGGWEVIKQEVDAGRPVIFRTVHNVVRPNGHYVVVVGYRQIGSLREVIVYDPYGRWRGTCCQDNYDRNNPDDPTSYKGKWQYYNFDTIFGSKNYLITASAQPSGQATTLDVLISEVPSTLPDQMSDEPEDIDTYEGVPAGENLTEIFLPLILKM